MIAHRAPTGDHTAAERSGEVERHRPVDGDDSRGAGDGMRCKTRLAEEVAGHVFAFSWCRHRGTRKRRRTVGALTREHEFISALTICRPAISAEATLLASGTGDDDVIAYRDVVDAPSHGFDDPGTFVPEDDGEGEVGEVAGGNAEIGVAQADGLDPHQHLVIAWSVQTTGRERKPSTGVLSHERSDVHDHAGRSWATTSAVRAVVIGTDAIRPMLPASMRTISVATGSPLKSSPKGVPT